MRLSSPQRLVAKPSSSLRKLERDHRSGIVLILLGVVAFGLLILQNIALWAHSFAGDSISQLTSLNRGQAMVEIAIASLSLVGIVQLAYRRRRESRRSGFSAVPESSQITWAERRELIAIRAGTFGLVLAALFVMLLMLGAQMDGVSMSLEAALSVVPTYVLMGYALFVGSLLAAISTLGLHVLHEIRVVLRQLFARILRIFVPAWRPTITDIRPRKSVYLVVHALRGPPQAA